MDSDTVKEQSIRIMKEAVMSFRISELIDCLKMWTVPKRNVRKAYLQNQVLTMIENLRNIKRSIPSSFIMKILQLESRVKNKRKTRRRRGRFISQRDSKSPFFNVVEVLLGPITIRSDSSIYFNLTYKRVQQLRSKQSEASYEIQILFEPTDGNEEWTPTNIRLRVNEEHLVENFQSPPIIYVTSYCFLRKNMQNRIDVEFPSNNEFRVTVSIVRRFSPLQLLKWNPIKEVCKVRNVLEEHFQNSPQFIYEVTLVCPDGQKIISDPCRSNSCSHPDVFDLMSFLEKVQYYLSWKCPVCGKPITYDSLELELFFKSYLGTGKVNFTFYRNRPLGINGRSMDPSIKFTQEIITLD